MLTLRLLFAGLLLACLVAEGLAKFPPVLGGGVGIAGGSTLNTSFQITNDGGSTSVSGTDTQLFGLPFADGAVCSGNAPVFKDGSTVIKFSYGLATYWGSGCLKWAAFMLRPIFTVGGAAQFTAKIDNGSGSSGNILTVSSVASGALAIGQTVYATPTSCSQGSSTCAGALTAATTIIGGSGLSWTLNNSQLVSSETMYGTFTHTVSVTCCGSWPSASAHTLSELYAQNIIACLPAASGLTDATVGANLPGSGQATGTYCGWVDDPSGDSNVYNTVKWIDGDDGACWRISTNMATTKAGAAQGQLVLDSYVCNLSDSSNAEGFFRWQGFVRQPKFNNDTPAKNWRAFAPPVYPSNGTVTNGPYWQTCAGVTGCTAAPGNQSGSLPMSFAGGDGNPMVGQAFTVSGASFTGSVANNTNILTTTAVTGTITVGNNIAGAGLVAGEVITSQTGGTTGGAGTYTLINTYTPAISAEAMTEGGPLNTTASNNYYLGSCADGNHIPFIFSGGSLPSPLVSTRVYWGTSHQSIVTCFGAAATGANNTISSISTSAQQGFGVSLTQPGSGTITPILVVSPFTRINFSDPTGKMNFFQGKGSIAAETTLRVQVNQSYWESTHVIPPFDTTISGVAFGGNVAETSYETAASYNPYNIVDTYWLNQDPGDHPDLGPWNIEESLSFYNDTKLDDFLIRTMGLAAGLYPWDMKDSTLDTIPNIIDATTTSSYTGLTSSCSGGACSAQLFINPGSASVGGYTGAPANCFTLEPSNVLYDHRPDYTYYAYVRTGQLPYLDFMVEEAQAGSLITSDVPDRNPTIQTFANGAKIVDNGTAIYLGHYQGDMRSQAWAHRENAKLYGIIPFDPTGTATTFSWGGTQLAKYMRTVEDNNLQFVADHFNSANGAYSTYSSYLIDSLGYYPQVGISTTLFGATLGDVTWSFGEESNYQIFGYLYDAMAGNANAKTILGKWISGQNYQLQTFGYNVYTFSGYTGIVDVNYFGWPPINTNNTEYSLKTEGGIWPGSGGISWTTSNTAPGAYTSTLASGALYNGDIIRFCGSGEASVVAGCGSSTPPGGLSAYTTYWICSVSNSGLTYHYNLCSCSSVNATNGTCTTLGSAIAAPTSSGSFGIGPGAYRQNSNLPAASTGSILNPYMAVEKLAAYKWWNAVNGSNTSLSNMITDASTRLANTPGGAYNNGSGNTLIGSFFAPRYSMQGCFGAGPC